MREVSIQNDYINIIRKKGNRPKIHICTHITKELYFLTIVKALMIHSFIHPSNLLSRNLC